MKIRVAASLALFATVTMPAAADTTLARRNSCLSCHGVEKRLSPSIPAFQEIAARYAASPDAQARLVAKVRMGGKGNWGMIAMPPNGQSSDADLQQLIRWVLAGAK